MATLPQRFTTPTAGRGNPGPQGYRIGGGGFTSFSWQNKPIAFAQSVAVQAAQPVAQAAVIQPLDASHPDEILTTIAVGPVVLNVQLWQRFQGSVWDDILKITDSAFPGTGGQSSYPDLQSVLARLAALGQGVQMTKFIYPPAKIQRVRNQYRAETFQNVKIVNIDDSENIDVRTMEIVKQMTVMATRTIPHNYNS